MKFVYTIFFLFVTICLVHAVPENELTLIISSNRANTLNGRIMVNLTSQKASQVIQFDKTNYRENNGKTYLYAKGDIPKTVQKASFFYDSGNFENLHIHNLTVNYEGNQGKAFFSMEKNIPSNTHNEVYRKYIY